MPVNLKIRCILRRLWPLINGPVVQETLIWTVQFKLCVINTCAVITSYPMKNPFRFKLKAYQLFRCTGVDLQVIYVYVLPVVICGVTACETISWKTMLSRSNEVKRSISSRKTQNMTISTSIWIDVDGYNRCTIASSQLVLPQHCLHFDKNLFQIYSYKFFNVLVS